MRTRGDEGELSAGLLARRIALYAVGEALGDRGMVAMQRRWIVAMHGGEEGEGGEGEERGAAAETRRKGARARPSASSHAATAARAEQRRSTSVKSAGPAGPLPPRAPSVVVGEAHLPFCASLPDTRLA